jgi:glycosyltransferase involved in cell wall biosynthesis
MMDGSNRGHEGDGKRRLRVAFVVQRCGKEVTDSAEVLCLQVALRMAHHWHVEILTTCAQDYITWGNHYPPGIEQLGAIKINRFDVAASRDMDALNRLSKALVVDPSASVARQEGWVRTQGPWSPALFDFIEANAETYDAFIFFGYPYAQTYFGLPAVANKAVLVPFAHDDWRFHLRLWNEFFKLPACLIFNSPEERDLVRTRFPGAPVEGSVLGMAVERPADIDPARFRAGYDLPEGYLLYVGRIDPSKGCKDLFEFFTQHVEATGDPRKLVLLGKDVMDVPAHPQIASLGFVDDATKWDALAGCDLLVIPSPHESLAMVLLEAWSVARPVLVNGRCEVLQGQCRRANGGAWYETGEDFSAAVRVLGRGLSSHALGRQGHAYVHQHHQWPTIEAGYLDSIRKITDSPNPSNASEGTPGFRGEHRGRF